ncbi:MAG: metal-dependent transcriptional regulator [Clostridia bacterium]|nr:metal-dependent transcriptional regulator [Clostridia bacterium]
MPIQESGEMYLETILYLTKEKGSVRAIDVAEHMGYSKPSVSRAVGLLKNGGYIEVDSEGLLILTKYGKDIAEKIYERHTMLTELFVRLGVDKETASDDACKIEHHLSDQTFMAIKSYIEKLK